MAELKEIATREAYGIALAAAGEKNKNIVALDADLSKSTRSNDFLKKFPERFFNVGISEQDLIGTAAGFAVSGKIPFASTFAVFATGRTYDQIRVLCAYSNTNVKIVGSHAGIATGEDGASHQALEDIALMRALPNMKVFSPADGVETKKIVEFMSKNFGPTYLRTCRLKTPTVFGENYEFELGRGKIVSEGNDLTIIATGPILANAIEAEKILKGQKINCRIVNMPCIKPLDEKLIEKCARETNAIVSVEDHSIIGGLGGAIAETLSEKKPTLLKRIGMLDKFGESGNPKDLYIKYGFDSNGIAKTVKEFFEKNKK